MKILFFLFLTMKAVNSWVEELAGHSLYHVTAFNYHDRQFLYEIHIKDHNVFFLNGVTNDAALPMIIVVKTCCTKSFEMSLQMRFIEYSKIAVDQFPYKNQRNSIKHLNLLPNETITQASDNFLDWNSIMYWVEETCKKYNTVKKLTLGATFENREIFVLELSDGKRKPAVVIMGGEQGRDWMPTAIILNFMTSLLENQNNKLMLETFDYYFVPVFNPDGYAYSMANDSFWMKNRKIFYPSKKCAFNEEALGVSVERNWFMARSTSVPDSECYSVFMGHRFLSEEETKAMSIFLNQISVNLIAFINLRGFGNLVTLPYAEYDMYANNQAILLEMLLFACKRVKEEFHITLKFSNTASCFCNSADWVKARLNVPIVYTIYLKQEPFLLPQTNHIEQLTQQFTLMTREVLMLGNSFYGPLFNKQTLIQSNALQIVFIIFKLLINYI